MQDAITYGSDAYAPELTALQAAGLPAEFITTGGNCAALLVTLEASHHLLISDAVDTLSWERADQCGWFVCLYRDEADDSATAIRWISDEDNVPYVTDAHGYDVPVWDNTPERLLAMVRAVLSDADVPGMIREG